MHKSTNYSDDPTSNTQHSLPTNYFIRPQRIVDKVFIHCTASDKAEHDSIDVIRSWHLARGWHDVGYHFMIHRDGSISKGRSLEKIPAAQYPHNRGTIAIVLHGLEIFVGAQFDTLKQLCYQIDSAYNHQITFHGHREVNPYKSCPVFDYKKVLNLDAKGYIIKSDR